MRVDVKSLSLKKRAQLDISTCNPHMYLTVENCSFSYLESAYFYEIEVGILSETGDAVSIHRVCKRFSHLFAFDKAVRQLYGNSKLLLPFPPKRWFGKPPEQFLKQRFALLQTYINNLVRVPGLCQSTPFTSAFL